MHRIGWIVIPIGVLTLMLLHSSGAHAQLDVPAAHYAGEASVVVVWDAPVEPSVAAPPPGNDYGVRLAAALLGGLAGAAAALLGIALPVSLAEQEYPLRAFTMAAGLGVGGLGALGAAIGAALSAPSEQGALIAVLAAPFVAAVLSAAPGIAVGVAEDSVAAGTIAAGPFAAALTVVLAAAFAGIDPVVDDGTVQLTLAPTGMLARF